MNKSMQIALSGGAICLTLIGVGCKGSDKDSSDANFENMAAGQRASAQAENGAPAPSDGSAEQKQADLPKGDPSVPDSGYVELNSNYQIGALFFALSGLPPNYGALDRLASEEYRKTSDSFRKRDLEAALKPAIDKALASSKDPAHRYFRFKPDGGLQLGHFDLGSKSFPLISKPATDVDRWFTVGGAFYSNQDPTYRFYFTNGDDFYRFPVADEAKAKAIEDLIAKRQFFGGSVTVYAFAQGADTSANRVQMQILRVVLRDKDQNEVGRILIGDNPPGANHPPGQPSIQFRQ